MVGLIEKGKALLAKGDGRFLKASRKVKRPTFKAHERGLLVLLSRMVHGWRDALLLVKPETILRWHQHNTSFLSQK
jgi:predicted metal-dependent hydrolase